MRSSIAAARPEYRKRWIEAGLYDGLSVDQWFRRGVERSPDTRLCFWSDQRPSETSLRQVAADVDRVAAALHRLGYQAGDVIAAQVPNWAECLHLFIAAMRLGLVFIPLVHILGPTELGFILRQSKARALVTPDRWGSIDYGKRFAAMDELPDLEHVVVIGEGSYPGPVLYWDELVGRAKGLPSPPDAGRADDICMILYTSGTTAVPKGALLTHANLTAESITMFDRWCDRRPQSAIALFPTGHIGGVNYQLRPFFTGDDGVYMDRFDAATALDLINRHQIRFASGVPLHLNALLDMAGTRKISSLSHMILGGAAVPPAVVERGEAAGIVVARAYGATEHGTISSGSHNDPLAKRARTDGRPMDGTVLRLIDEDGREVARGMAGEVATMGPELFQGYFDDQLNKDAFTPDGFFRTGDIAVMDDEGFLTIVDRKKDIVIRGGENISSKEVEDILHAHPSIEEAAVIGWPDDRMGEVVGAFVILRQGAELDLPTIQAHFLRSGVARQKTPERLMVVDHLPRTPVGKVKKHELRQTLSASARK